MSSSPTVFLRASGRLFNARLLVTILTCAMLPATAAAEDPVTDPRRGALPPAAEQATPPKCVHGCQRWGKFCNVDPRGVYKCQRRCEKFGEICE